MHGLIVKIIWLSVILSWYRPEYWVEAFQIEVVLDTMACPKKNVCPECILVGCYHTNRIHLDPTSGYLRMGLLHESLHHFQEDFDLSGFRRPALRYAIDVYSLSTIEIHAQLPSVLGYIPEELEPWYPWLKKEGNHGNEN